jgi:hypothetical protein
MGRVLPFPNAAEARLRDSKPTFQTKAPDSSSTILGTDIPPLLKGYRVLKERVVIQKEHRQVVQCQHHREVVRGLLRAGKGIELRRERKKLKQQTFETGRILIQRKKESSKRRTLIKRDNSQKVKTIGKFHPKLLPAEPV